MNTPNALESMKGLLTTHELNLVEQLVDLLGTALKKRYADTEMLRAAHPKAHGLVKAEFVINDEVPQHLRHGIFATPGRRFPAWVRFSNAGALPAADKEKDLRGCAIKLMGVEGEKLLPSEQFTQDLLLQSSNRFIVSTPEEFADFSKWIVKGKPMAYFLSHPRYMVAGLRAIAKAKNPLAITYWSAVPFALGENLAVKYVLSPNDALTEEIGTGPTAMREVMAKTLEARRVTFDFKVQEFLDEGSTPIDDAWHVWDEEEALPVSLASLHIPRQSFATVERDRFGESMAFNPWHTLSAHKPLGSMNRVRGALYAALSELRRSENHVSMVEPGEADAEFRGGDI